MNTIEGLKKLPNIIKTLSEERRKIQLQIDECYKPFTEIIKETLVVGRGGNVYIDEFGISDTTVCFVLRYKSDDECEDIYSFPIEVFLSSETFLKYIVDKNEQEAKDRIAKEEHNKRWAQKEREDSDRVLY